MGKTILLGIDGAPYTLLKKYIEKGFMPNLSKLASEGSFMQMDAPLPDNSAVSWSSIITGTNPGEHGVFGFTDLIPDTYTMRFPNSRNLNVTPFWNQNPDKKSVIINVPFTYPAMPLNGVMVSGFVSIDLKKAAYPEEFYKELNDFGYRLDVDTKKIYKSYDLFLDDLFKVHEIRRKTYQNAFGSKEWQNFMVVFTGTDRLGHYLIDKADKPEDKYYDRFVSYYKEIDKDIGWIKNKIDQEDILIMMSDHGMEEIYKEVYLNKYLEEKGFLELDPEKKASLRSMTEKTKAFVLEPSRIHLNYKDRYPGGSVDYSERESIITDLIQLFSELKYDGRKVIKGIFRKEEVYEGKSSDYAPDLVLDAETGFSLRGVIGKNELFSDPDILKGMHRGSDAFLFVNRPADQLNFIIDKKAKTEDIVKIINKFQEET